ncbi:MAG TPA: flagellar biosynthetic protein FliO [Bryobacteraceae bacterium]|nr:flagellar biosynthetic protein FliO [Bryobacteraceae bacterium]
MDGMGQAAAVAVVLALLAGTLWWLRRRGFAGVLHAGRIRRRNLECLERLPLGAQHALHLVRFGDTALLVASYPGGCRLVQSAPCRDIERQPEAAR